MIADETNAIREAMRKLAQAKVQGEAEAARKAATDDSKTTLPQQRRLFEEPGAPFRGFFLEQQAESAATFDADAWDEWDHLTSSLRLEARDFQEEPKQLSSVHASSDAQRQSSAQAVFQPEGYCMQHYGQR